MIVKGIIFIIITHFKIVSFILVVLPKDLYRLKRPHVIFDADVPEKDNRDDDEDDDVDECDSDFSYGSDDSDDSNESGEPLTQAQIDKWEEIADAISPTEFAWMDADGNCYDNEGHWVEFEYPNSYYGLTSEEEEGDEGDEEEDEDNEEEHCLQNEDNEEDHCLQKKRKGPPDAHRD